METEKIFISFGSSHNFLSTGMAYLPSGKKAFIAIVSESDSWSFLNDARVRNCDGVVLNILMVHIVQWPQEGLNYEPLTCSAVT